MLSFFKSKIKKALSSFTKKSFAIGNKIQALFTKKVDEESYEELEELFYQADLGTKASYELIEIIKEKKRKDPSVKSEHILSMIRSYLLELLQPPSVCDTSSLHIIMVVGVNGTGKTTSVAKLAKHYKEEGKKVLIVACDTFRAAAIDQLYLWAEKLHIDCVKASPGGDPAAVAFDAICKAEAKGYDVVILDTAGRLQTKTDLMQELEKIQRVCRKKIPTCPHQTLLVIDATTGQNAIDQANIFHKHTPLSGIILTKLDGSAKGGIVVSIYKNLSIPIQWIGVGEKEEDLLPFNPKEFVSALLEK